MALPRHSWYRWLERFGDTRLGRILSFVLFIIFLIAIIRGILVAE